VTDTLTRPQQAEAAATAPRGLPLKAGVAVYAGALPLWGLQAAAGHAPALIALLLAGSIAFLVVRSRTDAGRRPALAAVITATVWAGIFATFGLSWLLTAVWASAIGAFWPAWQRLRYVAAEPDGVDPDAVPGLAALDAALGVVDKWVAHVASRSPLKGTTLKLVKTDGRVHKFHVEFTPGVHTYEQLLGQRNQIISAMNVPRENVIIEEGRTGGYAQFTCITDIGDRPPVMYPGPSFDPTTGLLRVGDYDDDGSPAYFSIAAKNGVFGFLVCGDQGSGKSAAMEQIGLSLLASGYFTGLYVDPQGGMSSPALAEACEWTAKSVAEAVDLIRALPRWRRLRQIIFSRLKRNGYTLSKEHPALVVFIDEFQEIATKLDPADKKLLVEMSKTLRKLGGLLGVGTQNVGLPAFGGDNDLRAQLMSRNVLYFYTSSKQQGHLSGSNEFDPSTLPSGSPGYGYLKEIRVNRKVLTRAAPVRAFHLGDEEDFGGENPGLAWYRHLRQSCTFARLPDAEAGAFGAAFARRAAVRAEADAAAAEFLAACEAVGRGELDPEELAKFDPDAKSQAPKQEAGDDGLPSLRLGGPDPDETEEPVEEFPDAKKTQAILNALRAGAWRTAEIRAHAANYQIEISTSLVEQRLRQFVADGQAVRVDTGHYHVPGLEANCGHPRCRG
jgi:hypothetical protein